jgi:signal transduction histidine kinase/CheY-like chemotaxis protein/putative methionine-R-sulfoxide reductase with GAF domain
MNRDSVSEHKSLAMRNEHFLIVDDDNTTLKTIDRALTVRGFKTTLAHDGREALDIIENTDSDDTAVDIVITDIQMPRMDGVELLKNIKSTHPGIAVIAMTAFTEKVAVGDLFRSRCDNFIEKPFKIDELVELIDDTVEKHHHEQDRTRIIKNIEEKTNKLLNADGFFNRFLAAFLNELDIESGSLFMLNKKENELVLRGVKSGRSGPHIGLTKQLGEGVSGFAAQQKKPMLVVSRNDFKNRVKKGNRFYETESYLCLPILLDEELVGVVNFTQKKSRRPFSEDDLHFMLPLIEHFAVTLKQQHHQFKLKQRTRELSIKIRDTSDQLRSTEEELVYTRKFNMDVIDSIPLPIVVLDEDYRIKTANRIFCTDFAREENVEGRLFKELIIDNGEQRRWRKLLEDSFSDDDHYIEHFIHRIDDDTNAVLNIRGTLTRLPSCPNDRYLLLIIEDISDQVILKEKIEKSERLSEIGQLAAGVAHEINNPLDGVLRFTNLSLGNLDRPKFLAKCLEESKVGLERISRIVKSLLEYSRNISRKTKITSINQLLDEILVLMTYMQLRYNIQVVRSFNSELPGLSTFDNLNQVFTNIIKNAYEAMDQGGELRIVTDYNDDEIMIEFHDEGGGIPQSILKNLGKPFNTTKTKGTGLGLSICKEILAEHGGRLDVEKSSPAGTTFIIRIPRNREQTKKQDSSNDT